MWEFLIGFFLGRWSAKGTGGCGCLIVLILVLVIAFIAVAAVLRKIAIQG